MISNWKQCKVQYLYYIVQGTCIMKTLHSVFMGSVILFALTRLAFVFCNAALVIDLHRLSLSAEDGTLNECFMKMY